jgi:hypothetical protein
VTRLKSPTVADGGAFPINHVWTDRATTDCKAATRGADKPLAADGQSGRPTPPLMQHVARSRCAAEILRARDAQVTNRFPFEVTVPAV